jgi:hypothetical protein
MNIQEQQAIADELLSKLEIIAPHAILAGGAPRDWYMGNTANDLDFYFSGIQGLQMRHTLFQLDKVLPKDCTRNKDCFVADKTKEDLYKHLKGLLHIHYYEYKGLPVQFIEMQEAKDVFKAVDNFSCSICKVWYKAGKIKTTPIFLLTLRNKNIYLTDGYEWCDMHPNKMLARFEPQGFLLVCHTPVTASKT